MMRLIDADALRDRIYHKAFETDTPDQKWDSGCWIRYKMFERNIKNAPTVDAVPVVRCKDCKWGIKKTNCRGEDMINCCNTESPVCDSCMLTSPEWFCAEGEKEK